MINNGGVFPPQKVSLEALKISVVTWNVNAKIENGVNIRDLLFHVELGDSPHDLADNGPDLIVVCLQEVVELSPTNVVIGDSSRVGQWQDLISETLKADNFDNIACTAMVGLWIGLYSKPDPQKLVSKIQTGSFARGVGGVLGNKGAVMIRLELADTSVCFVNSHFAAHRENVLKRNEDFHAILLHESFKDYIKDQCSFEIPLINRMRSANVAYAEQQLRELKKRKGQSDGEGDFINNCHSVADACFRHLAPDDHDIIIWAGDLNYRIVAGIETLQVYDVIRQGRALLLAPYDQLNQERESGNVFQAFHEGLLTFEPTYKYIPGSDIFDNRKERKLRCPSWCDRVLWRIGRGLGAGRDSSNASTCANRIPVGGSSLNGSFQGDGRSTAAADGSGTSAMAIETEKKQRRQAIDMKRMTFSRGVIDYASQEIVELMKYNRCSNKISDHKPVRALLNVKVKKIDWEAYEKDLLKQYETSCLKQPHSGKSNYFLNKGVPSLSCSMRSVQLFSCLPEKRSASLILTNNLSSNSIQFSIEPESCPSWLRYSYESEVIAAGESLTLNLFVDHEVCTMQYAEIQDIGDKYRELPLLGKYVSTDQYYRKGCRMELCCIFVLKGVAVDSTQRHRGGNVKDHIVCHASATQSSSLHTLAPNKMGINALSIPVVCSLDNIYEYDDV